MARESAGFGILRLELLEPLLLLFHHAQQRIKGIGSGMAGPGHPNRGRRAPSGVVSAVDWLLGLSRSVEGAARATPRWGLIPILVRHGLLAQSPWIIGAEPP